MRRAPTLTKRQRRELDQVPAQRLQRPRTLTRMVAPPPPPPPKPLPEGWTKCKRCGMESQISALFVVHMLEPQITTNDADELIPNPIAGQLAVVDGVKIIGHMCPMCQNVAWPE